MKKSQKTITLLGVTINKQVLIFVVLVVIILLEWCLFLSYGGGFKSMLSYFHRNSSVSGIILFEGDNCSHCQTVENFIKNNNIDQKIAFTRLEVFNNSANANILADKSQICGLNPEQIGVPFLWDGKNCVVGDVSVIKFFKDNVATTK